MKEQILKLRKEGKTYNEIKEQLNCSKGTISYHCGNGQKQKTKDVRDKRRRKNKIWLEDLKKTLVCQNCNENRWWVLDFHHRDPLTKEKGVAFLIHCSTKTKVLLEIEKCDILCSNCHRDLHHQEKQIKL